MDDSHFPEFPSVGKGSREGPSHAEMGMYMPHDIDCCYRMIQKRKHRVSKIAHLLKVLAL